ncbi:LPXTG cell wall anchor domain-containing protein [Lacticaseibacillus saniviri]|nr:LPXTG cell wall anchor domain-containing protein [Lacticaseibacillus saniviri]
MMRNLINALLPSRTVHALDSKAWFSVTEGRQPHNWLNYFPATGDNNQWYLLVLGIEVLIIVGLFWRLWRKRH